MLKEVIKKLILYNRWRPSPKPQPRSFVLDENNNIKKRGYKDYQDYLDHQSEKLNVRLDEIQEYDKAYEQMVYDRYGKLFDYKGKTIICLAARLGGEVRAFKRLGALAIGIDIEPGIKNHHVLHGDFHQIDFPDGVFDFAFCNAVDHVLDLASFLSEVKRVLKKNGFFVAEIAVVDAGKYEVIDTKDIKPIKEIFKKYFTIHEELPIKNNIGFVEWEGFTLVLQKDN